ncbi:hypothetical protein BJX76DRAFT_150274 [Aspergillus varians]
MAPHRILWNVNPSSGGQLIKTTTFNIFSFSFILFDFITYNFLYPPRWPLAAIERSSGTDVLWILYPQFTMMILWYLPIFSLFSLFSLFSTSSRSDWWAAGVRFGPDHICGLYIALVYRSTPSEHIAASAGLHPNKEYYYYAM